MIHGTFISIWDVFKIEVDEPNLKKMIYVSKRSSRIEVTWMVWRRKSEWDVPSALASLQCSLVWAKRKSTPKIICDRCMNGKIYCVWLCKFCTCSMHEKYSVCVKWKLSWRWLNHLMFVHLRLMLVQMEFSIQKSNRYRSWYFCIFNQV